MENNGDLLKITEQRVQIKDIEKVRARWRWVWRVDLCIYVHISVNMYTYLHLPKSACDNFFGIFIFSVFVYCVVFRNRLIEFVRRKTTKLAKPPDKYISRKNYLRKRQKNILI